MFLFSFGYCTCILQFSCWYLFLKFALMSSILVLALNIIDVAILLSLFMWRLLVGEIGARHGINLDDLTKLKSILLKGDSNMTLEENNLLFDAVQQYISKSKRF